MKLCWFLHRFEDDKYVSDLFEELWEENTSGDRVTLQLYLEEIVSLICESIASSSWTSKRKVRIIFFPLGLHSNFPMVWLFILLNPIHFVWCLFVFCLHGQSAKAICKLGEILGESLSSYHHVLLESIMKEVPGRLWEVGRSLFELW